MSTPNEKTNAEVKVLSEQNENTPKPCMSTSVEKQISKTLQVDISAPYRYVPNENDP